MLLAVGAVLALATPANAVPEAAVIQVTFSDDDMGFSATSTKDISNVIVELCDGSLHKHDDLTGHHFNHTEDQEIVSVYVKSGNNGIVGNIPPGAGQRFLNVGVDCSETETETSGSETETETSGSETETETSGSETETPSDTETETETSGSETETETEEVPFFGTGPSMVALGTLGALGGAFLMLRRRL